MTSEGPRDDVGADVGARCRIAYLSASPGIYDSRTLRMARSAAEAGHEITVYARWLPGLPLVEQHDSFRLIRAPWAWQFAIPGLGRLLGDRIRGVPPRGWERARYAAIAPPPAALPPRPARPAANEEDTDPEPAPTLESEFPAAAPGHPAAHVSATSRRISPRRLVRRLVLRPIRTAAEAIRRSIKLLEKYPVRPLGWAWAVDQVAEPADIWHGMWAGSLPALDRLRRRHGGRAVYDSRDVYMQSRDLATAPRLLRSIMSGCERRWARRADLVISVNEACANVIAKLFGVPQPPVVMNCPEAWAPPEPPPNLLREALGLPATTAIVLYQGQLVTDRGIEQAMDAILDVPGATLVLLGHGTMTKRYVRLSQKARYAGRVRVLPAVPPAELLPWTASADVLVMAIQPSSLNHHLATPNKLFESIAAGVPVVASDFPSMAAVVRDIDAGVLCDPTSPAAIAAAIREVLDVDEVTRQARRARILAAAHARYNWETQAAVLHRAYRELLAG